MNKSVPNPRDRARRNFLNGCFRCALFCAGSQVIPLGALASRSDAQEVKKGFIGRRLSPYFTALPDKRVRCELCPRHCETGNGERGYCRVRENRDGKYYSLVFGNPCAVHIDPVEKKPFYHVLPSTRSFSIATAGCNFDCKFCQNWEISQARPDDTLNYELSPEQVVRDASRFQCASVASTYVEPTIFMEYMIEIGRWPEKQNPQRYALKRLCKPQAARGPRACLDAACIDLKGFTEKYYRGITEGTLGPVLETLKYLKRRANPHRNSESAGSRQK